MNSVLKQFMRIRQHTRIKRAHAQAFGRKISKPIGPIGWSLLIVPVSTFGLGTWQVQRKAWKEDLIRSLRAKTQSQPVTLPQSLNEIEELEYHPVHVKGEFLHNKELHMGPRTLITKGDASTSSSLISKDHNKSQGYLVITPFKLVDRDETILINRGWVPHKLKDPKTREEGQLKGLVDVIGIVRLHENRPTFVPANKEKIDNWFYRDLNQMSALTGASPIFLDATDDLQCKYGPIGGQTRITLRNEHLSYILTWYSLSMITSFMWFNQFLRK